MTQIKPDEILDLVGVACPQNSARALLKLEGMEPGLILKIIVDDGEPMENILEGVKDEGHKMIDIRRIDDVWILLVKKV